MDEHPICLFIVRPGFIAALDNVIASGIFLATSLADQEKKSISYKLFSNE